MQVTDTVGLFCVHQGFMLQWYVVKMFREACDANQVHVVGT
jgi:hypothetical protein